MDISRRFNTFALQKKRQVKMMNAEIITSINY